MIDRDVAVRVRVVWRQKFGAVSAAVAACAFALPNAAQSQAAYPAHPIKIVVGFTPGGVNDLLARLVAQKLGTRLGQPVVVENKPGAGGIIAAEAVARSAPDGYTLLIGPAGTTVINPAVYSKLPYDALKSYSHIAIVATYPYILAVDAAGPIKSIKQLIEFAKANPDKANYGSTSAIFQLTSELFNMKTGTKFEHIPFKSGAEIVAAILNGQVTTAFSDIGASMSQFRAGKLLPLATSGTLRFPDLPDVPTMKEAGIEGVEVDGHSGLLAPASTPIAVVKKLEGEVNLMLKDADTLERLKSFGTVAGGGTSEDYAAVIARDIAKFTAVAKAANIKLD
jgi:tripartite-type tricarboxylate transporter receptor subunit TctC